MADDDAEAAKDENADAEGEEGAGKSSGLKKILLIALPVLLLAGGGGAYFMGFFGGGEEEQQEVDAPPPPPEVFFLDLPEILVNLSNANERAQYLKLSISLEVADEETIGVIEPFMPRVLDAFQVYLRELRVSDLEGSSGVFLLKEELQRRIEIAIHPAKLNGVLFKEILIQ